MRVFSLMLLSVLIYGCDSIYTTCKVVTNSDVTSLYYEPMNMVQDDYINQIYRATYPLFKRPLIENLNDYKNKSDVLFLLQLQRGQKADRLLVEKEVYSRYETSIIISNIEDSVLVVDSNGIACVIDSYCYQIDVENLKAINEILFNEYNEKADDEF